MENKVLFKSNTQKQFIDMPVEEFIKKYMEYRAYHVRYNSRILDGTVIKRYLIKDDINMASELLSFENMEKTYLAILNCGAKSTWRNRAFGILRKINEQGYKWKIISLEEKCTIENILENIPEAEDRHPEKKIWSNEQFMKFMKCIDNEYDIVLFSMFFSLGLRISELQGLTWNCLDEENGYIKIQQQVINLGNHKEELTSELKTPNSRRVCKLSNLMLDLLKKHKNKTKINKFIFPSPLDNDAPLSKTAIRFRLNKYIALAKLPRITTHSFRHMKATEFMKVCQDMDEIKAASKFLGHTATMMMETYAHSSSKTTEAVLSRLNDEEIIKKCLKRN